MLYAYSAGYLCLGFLTAILMGLLWGWRYAPAFTDRGNARLRLLAIIMIFWPAYIIGSLLFLIVMALACLSDFILPKLDKES